MKVVVLGGNGFIGKRFVSLFGSCFEDIVVGNSKNAPMNDYIALEQLADGGDVIVHAAFDHSYKANIRGIHNILKICSVKKIKKLIYLSTVSVFDQTIEGKLNEDSKLSTLNDPYTREKIKIEEEIKANAPADLLVIILYPAIVYGLGGNWTKYAFHACKSKSLGLPHAGNGACNAVYVDDVANAIYKSCVTDCGSQRLLISCEETILWKNFYELHYNILKESGFPVQCNIQNTANNNSFHSNKVYNIIFNIWFRTPVGKLLNLGINIVKKIRKCSYADTNSKEALLRFLKSAVDRNYMEPIGVTRVVHSAGFSVDSGKALEILNFRSIINTNDGYRKMLTIIKEEIR